MPTPPPTAEHVRLAQDAEREKNWKRWGPYLSERQWGTVREDYSPDGNAWDDFPHEQARSRAYRWGEDGLLGFTDRECRLCFAVALWNGRDPILKERLFGLTNAQGNHGEDVKELYYYLDATPTASYCKALYKYPQRAFPYDQLVAENRRRSRGEREYELLDTGVFAEDRYFDVAVEYAKADDNDLAIRLTVTNRGPEAAALDVLPTLWFRNTWVWGCLHEGCTLKPRLAVADDRRAVLADHETLGKFAFTYGDAVIEGSRGKPVKPKVLFTENQTNTRLLYGSETYTPYVKDAFHRYVVHGEQGAVSPQGVGTKAAGLYHLKLKAGQSATLPMRLRQGDAAPDAAPGQVDGLMAARIGEADAFYARVLDDGLGEDERRVARQACAGLVWSKQFYHYVVEDWLDGDPAMPSPPAARKRGRNSDWPHLFNRDVISMPDKWEYPWYAAWDLAFHMIPFARIDPAFAKEQMLLMLREWYMHPNGQIPAYEWALGDVNPPVHAWACWRIYKMTGTRGGRDVNFLASCFQKLLVNFTWWVNRKDPDGRHVFAGGFLGLDNIGVFDRSQPLPGGGQLQQADGTAWMAFYCGAMLSMALELAQHEAGYGDMASKFFEHFTHIADAINTLGGSGLWDDQDGFYYDQIRINHHSIPLKVRSLVGLLPLIAVEVLEEHQIRNRPGFAKRMDWFLKHRGDLAQHIAYLEPGAKSASHDGLRLLALPSRDKLQRVLRYLFDENEFLCPFGIRSLSKYHHDHPFRFSHGGQEHTVRYVPGDAQSDLFGGNSNWRGPVWLPTNYLLIEALQRYHHFYGDGLKAEFPTGSGHWITLDRAADEIARRLSRLFLMDASGRRPYRTPLPPGVSEEHFRELIEFHEYFHGDSGRGLGASHQTGWTALIARCLEQVRHR